MRFILLIIITAGLSLTLSSQTDTICLKQWQFDKLVRGYMISNVLAKDTAILTSKIQTQSTIIRNQNKIMANDSIVIYGQRNQIVKLMNANVELSSKLDRHGLRIKIWRNVAIGFGGIALFNGIVAYVLAQ